LSREAAAIAKLMQKGRRRQGGFRKSDGFARTRREIERHARFVNAADSDDLSRWLIAWVWFNPQTTNIVDALMSGSPLRYRRDDVGLCTQVLRDPAGALMVSAACAMGKRDLTEVEAQAILEEAAATKPQMTADELGRWLQVTYAEREELRLTRIGCCDIGPMARNELAKRKRRLAQQERRRKQGAIPRDVWLETRLSHTKPWVQLGISRRTWERRRKKADVFTTAAPLTQMTQV
jgi:hypothetical protein